MSSNSRRLHKRQADSTLVRCRLNVIADYKFYSALTSSDDDDALRRAQAASLIRTFVGEVWSVYFIG